AKRWIILEVGIGGEYDPTNIIRNTKTVGITTIGIDHTSILGTTLEDIAWQKSGIVKERANVFTGVKQELCLKIIKQRCNEKKANLLEIPHVNLDNWTTKEVVKINTPLSVCLAYDWLTRTTKNKINGIGINILSNQNNFHKFLSTVLKQLENFQFPGRCQNVKIRNLNFYLDGAHTIESIILASRWFIESTKGSSNEKVLVFNLTGDRDPLKLMKVLYENCKLSLVCFTPNTPYIDDDLNSNFNNFSEVDKMKNVTEIAESCRNNFKLNSMVFTHILKVFEYISKRFGNEEVDVLVTGSLYLIGATLVALEKFSSNTRFE
ncbi:FPGS family protein, partial [Megaselia abdita]